MYNKGDYVVKSNTGICRVDDITFKKLTEDAPEKQYYVLVPLDDMRARLFVPTMSENPNIRAAFTETMAWEFIRSIPDIESSWIENDKMREKVYKDAMRSNDPSALIGIIKNMYQRRKEREIQGKKSTAVDERYFKLAEKLLYSELAHAIGKKKDDMKDIIFETIGK